MSIALYQALKALQARVESLESVKPVGQEQKQDSSLLERVQKLENQYRMLNARVARGKTDG